MQLSESHTNFSEHFRKIAEDFGGRFANNFKPNMASTHGIDINTVKNYGSFTRLKLRLFSRLEIPIKHRQILNAILSVLNRMIFWEGEFFVWTKHTSVYLFCYRWQVVLCFSPVGSTLRVRSRKFPAVTNCTAIDWFHEWPQEALVSVSKRFIDDLEQLEVRD